MDPSDVYVLASRVNGEELSMLGNTGGGVGVNLI
jgi:hypothetical protein